jgi:hypothetical protein
MRFLSITSFLISFSISGMTQDTLWLLESEKYGYSAEYIMYGNGNFIYESRGHCTGSRTTGSGVYSQNRSKLNFDFTLNENIKTSSECIKYKNSDSLEIILYDAHDSTEIPLGKFSDSAYTNIFWNNSKVPQPRDSYEISALGYESVFVIPGIPGGTCILRVFYLERKSADIPEGTHHSFKNQKGMYVGLNSINRKKAFGMKN